MQIAFYGHSWKNGLSSGGKSVNGVVIFYFGGHRWVSVQAHVVWVGVLYVVRESS
jgi:hypothetical protein